VRALAAIAAIAAVTTLLGASPASATTIRLKLTTSTATPAVDEAWRYTLTVRSASGVPLRARVKLQLLLGTTVVGCWKKGAMRQCSGATAGDWIAFRGKRTGVLRFPAQSVGVRLTFQATVHVQGQTRKLRTPVTVQAATAPLP
jgi:hypothetical protein